MYDVGGLCTDVGVDVSVRGCMILGASSPYPLPLLPVYYCIIFYLCKDLKKIHKKYIKI